MHNKLRKVIEDSLKHMAWVCTPGRVFLMSQTLSVWTERLFKFTRVVCIESEGVILCTRIENTDKTCANNEHRKALS